MLAERKIGLQSEGGIPEQPKKIFFSGLEGELLWRANIFGSRNFSADILTCQFADLPTCRTAEILWATAV